MLQTCCRNGHYFRVLILSLIVTSASGTGSLVFTDMTAAAEFVWMDPIWSDDPLLFIKKMTQNTQEFISSKRWKALDWPVKLHAQNSEHVFYLLNKRLKEKTSKTKAEQLFCRIYPDMSENSNEMRLKIRIPAMMVLTKLRIKWPLPSGLILESLSKFTESRQELHLKSCCLHEYRPPRLLMRSWPP